MANFYGHNVRNAEDNLYDFLRENTYKAYSERGEVNANADKTSPSPWSVNT